MKMKRLELLGFSSKKPGYRDIAQFGRALPWGGRGHRFEPCYFDHDFILKEVIPMFRMAVF